MDSTVVCPYCGTENPRGPIITLCRNCRRLLEEPDATGSPRTATDGRRLHAVTRTVDSLLEPGMGWALAACVGFFAFVGVVLVLMFPDLGTALIAVVLVALAATMASVAVRVYLRGPLYDLVEDPAPAPLALGASLNWGVTVTARRRMEIATARLQLSSWEWELRAGGGMGWRNVYHGIHQEVHEFAGRTLEPGESLTLRADFVIPAGAVPSYLSIGDGVVWAASLVAPVKGPCPDVRREARLLVLPEVLPDQGAGLPGDPEIPAAWVSTAPTLESRAESEGLSAVLEADEGDMVNSAVAVPVGVARRLKLTVRAGEHVGCRRVSCSVDCRLHGVGTEEKVTIVEDHPIHEGELRAGDVLEQELNIEVPLGAPVTYSGRLVKRDWRVRLHFELPFRPDRYLDVPFLVTPRRTTEGGTDAQTLAKQAQGQ